VAYIARKRFDGNASYSAILHNLRSEPSVRHLLTTFSSSASFLGKTPFFGKGRKALLLSNMNDRRAGLSDLPRELRDIIYELALVASAPISILNLTSPTRLFLPTRNLGLTPALLVTSRAVYAEAVCVLYGNNIFRATLELTLRCAQRFHEAHAALRSLHLPSDFDPPALAFGAFASRSQYTHPNIKFVRRLELKIEVSRPDRPHWCEPPFVGARQTTHDLADICRVFIEHGQLDLCVFSTEGCGGVSEWMPAAADITLFAQALHTTISSFHEWHFERVLLAAARQTGYLWINDGHLPGSVNLAKPAFHKNLRTLTDMNKGRNMRPSIVTRTLPKRFQEIGYNCKMSRLMQ